MPLADRLLTRQMLQEPEPRHPLTVVFCEDCSLVQITETVPPEILFWEDYPYYSSFSPALLEHSRDNALDLLDQRSLSKNSLVVELASNDGYLLKNFVEHGVPVLGIDPAEGPARAARETGVETLCKFFGLELARELCSEGRRADVIIANNVLAHVPDLNGFVEGIGVLLKEDGVAVIEAPYLVDLVDHCEFDTIYHEHLCYFSVTALSRLFERHGLHLNDVKRLSIHGGSLRLYIEHRAAPTTALRSLIDKEAENGVTEYGYYRDFADRVGGVRDGLRKLLEGLKKDQSRIAAYGAAAKGTTLINYVGIGPELVDFVVDRNVHKHGKYMPGLHLPIYPCETLLEERPDYVLLLAWNFINEISQQQRQYLSEGGEFIVPVPTPRIVRTRGEVSA
jgi:SAM-dependent methyltransferase